MQVQPLEQIDLIHIPDLLPPGWDTAMPSITFYTTSHFCFPLKVVVDRVIAGTGTAIIHKDVAWLAHIIVHSDYRNQGIGQFITRKLVDIAKAKNCVTIYLLATELGEPVYSKVGFVPETEYLLFKGEIQSDKELISKHIVACTPDFKKQISLLDRQVSGEDRMFHLEPHMSSGYVYLEKDKVIGYYLPALGDGLIIASTKEAGQELMRMRLTSKDFAVFPKDNIPATEFIQLHHFKETRRQRRMRYGQHRKWEPAMMYNRIGGNLG